MSNAGSGVWSGSGSGVVRLFLSLEEYDDDPRVAEALRLQPLKCGSIETSSTIIPKYGIRYSVGSNLYGRQVSRTLKRSRMHNEDIGMRRSIQRRCNAMDY